MGLEVSHDCWSGAYPAFMLWRQKLAEVAGLPPLNLMEGFWEYRSSRDPIFQAEEYLGGRYKLEEYTNSLPIRWSCLRDDPYLYQLLHHSDCDGSIPWQDCKPIAERLNDLLPELEKANNGSGHISLYVDKTRKFIDGLRMAYDRKEDVIFHGL